MRRRSARPDIDDELLSSGSASPDISTIFDHIFSSSRLAVLRVREIDSARGSATDSIVSVVKTIPAAAGFVTIARSGADAVGAVWADRLNHHSLMSVD